MTLRIQSRGLGWCLPFVLLLACATPSSPVTHSEVPTRERLGRLAVLPFTAHPTVQVGTGAALVERFLTEALSGRGLDVIPGQELRVSFESSGESLPDDPAVAAHRVARDFAANSLLVGEVRSFRERGEARGAQVAASVAFRLRIYAATGGHLLWQADFEETQIPWLEAPARARQYPGGGRRWLSAATLARWGAERVADALLGVGPQQAATSGSSRFGGSR